jgi:hypothetical protein
MRCALVSQMGCQWQSKELQVIFVQGAGARRRASPALEFLEILRAVRYRNRRSKPMETLVGGVNTLITWFKIVATMDKDVRGQLAACYTTQDSAAGTWRRVIDSISDVG